MEPALDVLDRALQGEDGSLSFLSRTSSIYVLNYSSSGPIHSSTYGCWNFMNEALNEIERFHDTRTRRTGSYQSLASLNSSHHSGGALHGYGSSGSFNQLGFTPEPQQSIAPHIRLLCTMCRKAAKRSPSSDRQLIQTCLSNAGFNSQNATELVELNVELRERVMGRIATMVFDPSPASWLQETMDPLCEVLAANLIASGPDHLESFALSWVVPSANSMPPHSLLCIVSSIADEAMSKTVPFGTSKMLGILAPPFVTEVVAPILSDALSDGESVPTDANRLLCKLGMRCIERLCAALNLRVDEIKSLSTKPSTDIVAIISDSLYSDAEMVVDVVADLIETVVSRKMKSSVIYDDKMAKRRKRGESFDTGDEIPMEYEGASRQDILKELCSAVALQRFRFLGRQNQGEFGVCRGLARIAASVGAASRSTIRENPDLKSSRGLLEILVHAISHPSVYIGAISLEVLPVLVIDNPLLVQKILPLVQRRTAWPVVILEDGIDECGVDFHEFEAFRMHVLGDILNSCYLTARLPYLSSCVDAIEKICVSNDEDNWINLEAALYCINGVSLEVSKYDFVTDSEEGVQHDQQLVRCVRALAGNPNIVSTNPLVLTQVCSFVGKYAKWFATSKSNEVLDSGAMLSINAFGTTSPAFQMSAMSTRILEMMNTSPFSVAAESLRDLLYNSPNHFTSKQALDALLDIWGKTYAFIQQPDAVELSARKSLCSGICQVLLTSPEEQHHQNLELLANPTITCLEAYVSKGASSLPSTVSERKEFLQKEADEVHVLSIMVGLFGVRTTTSSSIPSISILKRIWPCLSFMASNQSNHDIICSALGEILERSVIVSQLTEDLILLKDICSIIATVIESIVPDTASATLLSMFQVIIQIVESYGSFAEPTSSSPHQKDISLIIGTLLMISSDALASSVGYLWSNKTHQIGGQHPSEASLDSLPLKNCRSSESLAGIFKVLTQCLKSCPLLIIQANHKLFEQSFHAAVVAINEKEVDTARDSMLFLKSVFELRENHCGLTPTPLWHAIGPFISDLISKVRVPIAERLIRGTCGSFSVEIIDPAALLFFQLLKTTQQVYHESLLVTALRQERFRLGDEARIISLKVLSNAADSSVVMDFMQDLWYMHESDDTGSVAGGDAIKRLERKFLC